MYGYVYLTTNSANGKIYVGQKKSKVFLGEKYLGSGVKLKSAIKHYGKDVFTVKLIDTADDQDSLNEKEIYWISYYNSTDEIIGYNISSGGGQLDGFKSWSKGKHGLWKHTEEAKRKISEGNSRKTIPEEQRKKISASNSGKKRTEEQNQKNRERNIGRKFINKDGINKSVPGDQVQKYLDEGWNLGKIIRYKYVPWNKG